MSIQAMKRKKTTRTHRPTAIKGEMNMKRLKRYAGLIAGASLLTAGLGGCSSPVDAERALTGMGYKNIQTHGLDLFACSGDDFYSTKFTATNPAGQQVSGVVCSGLIFKGATVRF